MHITDWWATLSTLVGQSVDDPKAGLAGLPPPDSIDMWPMLTGANATSPRTTLVLRAMPDDDQAAIIRTLTLPGTAVPTRMKLVVGGQGGYWGGVYAPNTTAAVKLAPCGAGCLFNLDLDPTEHVDLSKDPRYASTLKTLQDELEAARATYYQSPGTKAGDKAAVPWAKAHGGFWGPWLPGEPPRYRCHLGCILLKMAAISLLAGPYVPPPPSPPPHPVPPTPPTAGFILRRGNREAGPQCLTVLGLKKAAHAVYGECDGGSHWTVDPESGSGALVNVAAKSAAAGYLRESPGQNCSAGNSAQLGVSGGSGDIVTVFDESGKIVILCLYVALSVSLTPKVSLLQRASCESLRAVTLVVGCASAWLARRRCSS